MPLCQPPWGKTGSFTTGRWGKAFGFAPDAIIVIDSEIWEDFSNEKKIALVYHEMRHIGHACSKQGEPRYKEEDGLPVLEIVDHDIEEFLDVVGTFGAWHEGLEAFGTLLNGKADEKRIREVMKILKWRKG